MEKGTKKFQHSYWKHTSSTISYSKCLLKKHHGLQTQGARNGSDSQEKGKHDTDNCGYATGPQHHARLQALFLNETYGGQSGRNAMWTS